MATWNWRVSAVMAALVAMASDIALWVCAMAPALVVESAGAVVVVAGEVTASGMVVLLQWWWAPCAAALAGGAPWRVSDKR
jgi:hypothetical protein